MSNEPESIRNEQWCDRKAMYYWSGAGKPEGQYPVYRKAVAQWSEDGAVEGAFDQCLKAVRDSISNDEQKLKEQQAEEQKLNEQPSYTKLWGWPLLTAVFIPLLAFLGITWQIQASKDSLDQTIEVQREQNRQQVLKDYISQMTSLIADKDLVNKYRKNEKGEYDLLGKRHPDAIAASSLTKTVLKLLEKKSTSDEGNSYNVERGSLVVFLHDSKLIQAAKPVIELEGANLRGADLERANLFEANFKGVDLWGANLRGANFKGANLAGANLVEAELGWVLVADATLTAVVVKVKDRKGKDRQADFRHAWLLTDEQKAYLKSLGALVD